MELTLNRGVLGQYDTGSNLRYKGKEKYVDKFFEYIAGAIAIIAAVVLFFSCLGACMGCKSVLSCYEGCSCSCAKYIVESCYENGENCRTNCGCRPSGSSSSGCSPSTTSSTKTYKAYNSVTGQYDYWYVITYKSGGKVVSTQTESEFSLDTTYWNLEGIYSDKQMTKEVTLESMKTNKVYYTKWSKVDEGVEYTLSFTLSDLSGQSSVLSVQHANVGADEIDWTEVWNEIYYNLPERPNYVFKGIFYNDIEIIDAYGNVNVDFVGTFDLETWTITPGNRRVTVDIVYEPTQINVKFVSTYTDEIISEGNYNYGDSLYTIVSGNNKLNTSSTLIDYYQINEHRYDLYDLYYYYLEEDIVVYVDAHKEYYNFKAYDSNGNKIVDRNVEYKTSYGNLIWTYLYEYYYYDESITGFSFEGSTQATIYTYDDIEEMYVVSDVQLYLRAVPFYTIVFHVGNEYYQARIPEGTSNLPDVIDTYMREGFTFGGWFLTPELSGTPVTELSYVANNEITDLYAKLTGRQYMIYCYDDANGNSIKQIPYTASPNEVILPGVGEIDVPNGYTFEGKWYDRDDENKTPITKIEAYDYGNKYLVAILVPKQFKVELRYDVTKGYIPSADRLQSLDYGSTKPLPLPNPNEGYEFKGYKYNDKYVTNSEGEFIAEFKETLFNMSYSAFSAYEINSIKLDAVIEIKKFAVSLVNGNETISNQQVDWNSYPVLSSSPTPNQGDVFEGWSKDPLSSTGKALETFVIKENTTLYAIYSKKRISIYYVDKFKPTSNVILPSTSGAYIKYSTEKDTPNAVSKPDYTNQPYYEFDGYKYGDIKVADKTGKLLIDFNENSLGIDYDTLVQGIELEVESKLREFTVLFYDKNGTYGEPQVLNYHDHITKPADPTPLDGYSFTYWTKYNETSEFNFSTYQVESDISLYSNYSANKYTVNLVVDDFADKSYVTLPYSSVQLTYDGAIQLTPPTYPSGNNYEYEFVGYYIGDNKLTETNGAAINNIRFNKESLSTYGITNIHAFEDGITITAKYQSKQYTVTYYDYNYSSIYNQRTVKWGTYAPVIDGPEKDGNMFIGWGKSPNPGNTTLYVFTNETVKSDLVLYPKYTNQITVKFFAQDGINPLDSITITYGQPLVISDSIYYNTGVSQWALLDDPVETIAQWIPQEGQYYISYHQWSSTFSTDSVTGEINLIAKSAS